MTDDENKKYDDEKREIFTSRVRAGSRTYYFDIKKNSKDDNYLVISESKRTGDDERQRHRIMVFEEDIEKFSNSFFQVISYFLESIVDIEKDELTKFKDSFHDVLDHLNSLTRHSYY